MRPGARDGAVCRFGDCFRRADEGEDRAVMVSVGFPVEEDDLGDGEDCLDDRVDLRAVAAFREVGDAFDELSGHANPQLS